MCRLVVNFGSSQEVSWWTGYCFGFTARFSADHCTAGRDGKQVRARAGAQDWSHPPPVNGARAGASEIRKSNVL
jgi:hypothetical protein